MGRKTGGEIEADIYAIINGSSLKTTIAGSIYKSGMRPINAKSEDAVISFLTGQDNQIQTGVVNINIYIPDIDNNTAQPVKNASRANVLEAALNALIQGLTPTEYRFKLDSTIQTFQAEGTRQHFINARLKFELATF